MPPPNPLVEQMRATFPNGHRVSDARILDVRPGDHPDEVVLAFRWRRDCHTYGVRVDLSDPTREYMYGTRIRPEEWLTRFSQAFAVQLETGLVLNCARSGTPNLIELDTSSRWSWDDRFTLREALVKRDGMTILRIAAVAESPDADPYQSSAWAEVANPSHVRSTLLAAGQIEGVPDSALLDATRYAVHLSGQSGALRVRTTLELGILRVLGFTRSGTSFEVRTDFLGEDFTRARFSGGTDPGHSPGSTPV